jgi:hypothetical protein
MALRLRLAVVSHSVRGASTYPSNRGRALFIRPDVLGHRPKSVSSVAPRLFETTASASMWTWHLLSQHPNVAAKLVEEVRRVLRGVSP